MRDGFGAGLTTPPEWLTEGLPLTVGRRIVGVSALTAPQSEEGRPSVIASAGSGDPRTTRMDDEPEGGGGCCFGRDAGLVRRGSHDPAGVADRRSSALTVGRRFVGVSGLTTQSEEGRPSVAAIVRGSGDPHCTREAGLGNRENDEIHERGAEALKRVLEPTSMCESLGGSHQLHSDCCSTKEFQGGCCLMQIRFEQKGAKVTKGKR